MGNPRPHPPTILIAAIFSRYPDALGWVTQRMEAVWGKVMLASPVFDFTETAYYERLMGPGLKKQLLAIEGDYDPAQLSDTKLTSNQWESEYAASGDFPEERPLNIDPGYVTMMKVVLASTKDRRHRIYLRDGIFAEECLYYDQHAWQGRPWTYPDYLRSDYHAFLIDVRKRLKG